MAVAVGQSQRQRLYSGVRMFSWFRLSSKKISGWLGAKGSKTNLSHCLATDVHAHSTTVLHHAMPWRIILQHTCAGNDFSF
jgi:hypothetical protein